MLKACLVRLQNWKDENMQDYALFCLNRMRVCFYRRRKYPVNSEP